MADNLPGLVHYLKKYTGSTGVYIGRLQYPERKIKIDDDDKAHLDYEAEQVIKFIHASEDTKNELEDHKFVEGTFLKPRTGVTHDVFGPNYARQEAEQKFVNERGEEEVKHLGIFERFKHIYVPEVVREPRMHYQRVPRLGSFMAIPLVYKSCLFDDSLTEAVANWKDV